MKRISLLVVVLLAFSGSSARGEIFYDIYFRGAGLDNSNVKNYTLDVAPNATFNAIDVVLRETVTNGSASLLAAANLNAYAVVVKASGSDGSFNNLTLNTNGGFAGGANNATTLNYVALGPGFLQPGQSSVDLGGGLREASLGTLNIVGPSTSSTIFSLSDFSSSDGDFTTFLTGANGLEGLSLASGGGLFGQNITLNAAIVSVPEPSSFVLAGLAAGGMLFWRRRSKKQA